MNSHSTGLSGVSMEDTGTVLMSSCSSDMMKEY